MQYIKVPREIIYAKDIGDKRIACFTYFVFHMGLNDRVLFYCNYLIEWCHFKPKRDKGCMNDKFKKILSWMYTNGLIHNFDDNDFDEKRFSSNSIFVVDINREWFSPSGDFALIFDFEIEVINDYYQKNKKTIDTRISWATILLVLSYVRCNIRHRPKECYETASEIEKCPEILFRKYMEIADDIGISERVVSKCIKILCELEILIKADMPRFKDKSGNWHTDSTIFTNKYKYVQDKKTKEPILFTDYKPDREIKYGKKLVASRKLTITSEKIYEEDFNII